MTLPVAKNPHVTTGRAEPFCACGRVVSECDGSRKGCARSVHFFGGYTLVQGALVERIRSGIVTGRIEIQGGRESALMVSTPDGPQVVRQTNVRVVSR